MVPDRWSETYTSWLRDRGEYFRSRVEMATLDPFHGWKNAVHDQLEDARSVLDAFHVVRLDTQAVDEVRRRVQQDTTGHRGRRGDQLYRMRIILRVGGDRLNRLAASPVARRVHRGGGARRGRAGLAVRPAAPCRPPPGQLRRRSWDREKIVTTFAPRPYPRGCPPRQDLTVMEQRVPMLRRHQRREKRRHRSRQRPHRA
ncbi:transposase [Nostocoides sp. Soil756]|uniref:transposase n=1 Tax=Nostocoides sp. Soil756 TaxID=1736399 RepID=UPI0009EB4C83|nr:transposase [Tetrasphaera sp. Soil756]